MADTKTQTKATEVEDPKSNTQIATAANTDLSASFDDDEFFGLETGMEDITSADLTLPRYQILQGLSPQVNPRKDEYIEGAKMGMILNTATNRVTDSISIVAAAYERRNLEWVPRDKPCPLPDYPQITGGGLYRDYGTDDAVLAECRAWEKNNSLWTPRGHELVPTGTWYVIDPDTLSTAFIAMGKTQLTSSKKLMAGIRDEKIHTPNGIRPAPLFYRVWHLSTRIKQDGENEWFVWNHKPGPRIQEHVNGRAILDMVKEIVRTIKEGTLAIDVTVGENVEGEASFRSSRGGEDARM